MELRFGIWIDRCRGDGHFLQGKCLNAVFRNQADCFDSNSTKYRKVAIER